MSLRKWILTFFVSCIVFALPLAIFNITVDPFGVFGDHFLDWYEYNMTQNARVAKIAYLDVNHDKYDSYILGCSKASSLSVERLNEYTGDRWYNLTWYGADKKDEERVVRYLLDNYEVKNIIVTVDPESATSFDGGLQTDLKRQLHASAYGDSVVIFYLRHLFANPVYGLDKLDSYIHAELLQDSSHVYVAETGSFNKERRDASPISDIYTYLDYEDINMDMQLPYTEMPYIDEAVESVDNIRHLCESNGVEFTLIGTPVSSLELESYPRSGVLDLWYKLADITDFYTFWGYNSVNNDLRYFYDLMHFRNNVGDMVLATIFEDDSVYTPNDFGVLTTADNVVEVGTLAFSQGQNAVPDTVDVPILAYHSFTEEDTDIGQDQIWIYEFEQHLRLLKESGYTSVTYQQLMDYVYDGIDLPGKPVVITIDDGYKSNIDLAAPLLENYGFSANIAVIGVSIGKSTYKDTGVSITEHFSFDDVQPWVAKGVFSITTHSYDMHQIPSLDGVDCRRGVLRQEGESELEYVDALSEDYKKASAQLTQHFGEMLPVYTYPYGEYSELSEVILHELGAKITVTTDHGVNQLLKGCPQSLYQLRRLYVGGNWSANMLLSQIELETQKLH